MHFLAVLSFAGGSLTWKLVKLKDRVHLAVIPSHFGS